MASTKKQPPSERTDADAGPSEVPDVNAYKAKLWRMADSVPFAEKMAQLTAQWREQQAEARRLDDAIADNLARLGFGDDG